MSKIKCLVAILIVISCSYRAHSQLKEVAAAYQEISNSKDLANKADEWIGKIEDDVKKVEESQAYKTIVDGASVTFPFAILPESGDKKYALIVSSVKMDPVKGMTAVISMKIPDGNGNSLYFLADQVPISKTGSLSGDFKLLLLKSYSIEIGSGYDILFKGIDMGSDDSTYVSFDCKGFKKITLNGSVIFDKEAIEKYNENDKMHESLSLNFFITADRMDNFVVDLKNIPDFQFRSLPGFKCSAPRITLDKSCLQNAPNFSLPEDYKQAVAESKSTNPDVAFSAVWEGLYIPQITLTIPPGFTESAKNNSKKNITIDIKNLIIDEYGVTAYIKAKGEGESKLFSGEIKSFEYNIKQIELNLSKNNLVEGSVEGGIALPITDNNAMLEYKILVYTKDQLIVNGSIAYDPKKPITTTAFANAELSLTDAQLDFSYQNRQFYPKATISGGIKLNLKKDSPSTGSFDINCAGLILSCKEPYIDLAENGYVELKPGATLAKLPVSIEGRIMKSDLKNQPSRLGLRMTLNVHLQSSGNSSTSKSANDFSGTASCTIWTKRNESTRKWEYDDKFDLDMIAIHMSNDAYKLNGELKMFENDAVYRQGFCGFIDVDVIDKFHVKAATIFGKQTDFDYWFVDFLAQFNPGIPVFSGVEVNAFTGGLYHNMSMSSPNAQASQSSIECKTASGRTFTPDKNTYLGLMAGLGIQSPGGGTAYNGIITFGIEFNDGGGVKTISTMGNVNLMNTSFNAPGVANVGQKISKEKPSGRASDAGKVSASWFVMYDLPNATLTGTFDVFVDFSPIVSGAGEGYKAGTISLLASPSAWYVYVGRPSYADMVGLNILNLAKIQGYFCIGSQLPNPPIAPLPDEIRSMVPPSNADKNLLALGGGMSFGARLNIEGSPGVSVPVCDASVKLNYAIKAGFDILIAQSLNPIKCSDNISDRGINRWYATGQAYLYGGADLTASYRCWWGGGSLDLLSLYLKTVVMAELPNPTHLYGDIAVGFTILCFEYNEKFAVEIGDKCESKDMEANVSFISAITPSDGNTGVRVGDRIAVSFSRQLEKFTYKVGDKQFRAVLADMKNPYGNGITITANGAKLEGMDVRMNPEQTKVVFTPRKVMPENTKITVTVDVITQSYNGSSWTNTNKIETKSITFTTGEEPRKIPKEDIVCSYPLPDMINFYKDESRKGYIRLGVLPSKSIELPANFSYNVAIYKGNEEVGRSRSVQYNATYGQNNFTYDIPNLRLENSTLYTLKLVKAPNPTNTSTETDKKGNFSQGTLEKAPDDIVITEYPFKTSNFPTFKEKMAYLTPSFSEVFEGVVVTELSMKKSQKAGISFEPLSDVESQGFKISGVAVTDKLVQFGSVSNILLKNADVSNDSQSITISSDELAKVNDGLKKTNLNCLIAEGCSSDQLKAVNIPAGKMMIPVEYHLPGEAVANSMYSISVDIESPISLPK